MVKLFLLLPESNPSYDWTLSNSEFQDEEKIITFIKELKEKLDSISVENFQGYYDGENITNFLIDFSELEDYYPKPSFRRLKSILYLWDNWRDEVKQKECSEYYLFNQKINNHTFCECAQIKFEKSNTKTLILNHYGYSIKKKIVIELNSQKILIYSVENQEQLTEWFIKNRIPKRNFHIIPKHGENREDIRNINNEVISPLRCSCAEAQVLLNSAIGNSVEELFNFDEKRNAFIVFKSEGENPQNLYHGFHLPKDSIEIPESIKNKLIE